MKFIEKYLKQLKLKYNLIKKANGNAFPLRIIAQEVSQTNHDITYTVQITKKNLIFKLQATELFRDQKLLSAFSPYELLKFLNHPKKKASNKTNLVIFPCQAQYKLIAKNFDYLSQQTLFVVEITQNQEVTHKKLSALEIVNNPLIFQKLHPQETYEIGFAIGSEAILKEMNKLAHLSNASHL
jgi:hypothetical protein